MNTFNIILTFGLIVFLSCQDSNNQESDSTAINDTTTINSEHDLLLENEAGAELIIRNTESNAPFDTLDYDKVIAYDYEGKESNWSIIDENGKLESTVKQQKNLNQSQVDDLTFFLGDVETYGAQRAACFEPHLGIVFYKKNNIVAHFSICLECNYMISSIRIPAASHKKIRINSEYEDPQNGFSKIGRKKINDLCRQLNFSHCLDTLNTIFDE